MKSRGVALLCFVAILTVTYFSYTASWNIGFVATPDGQRFVLIGSTKNSAFFVSPNFLSLQDGVPAWAIDAKNFAGLGISLGPKFKEGVVAQTLIDHRFDGRHFGAQTPYRFTLSTNVYHCGDDTMANINELLFNSRVKVVENRGQNILSSASENQPITPGSVNMTVADMACGRIPIESGLFNKLIVRFYNSYHALTF